MSTISNKDKDRIRKVAALTASPHDGEAMKSMRLTLKLLADQGGPSTFVELIELALAVPTKRTQTRSDDYGDSSWDDIFSGHREEEVSHRPPKNESNDIQKRIKDLCYEYGLHYNIQSAECTWVMVSILNSIRMHVKQLGHSAATKVLNSTSSKSWEFVADMYDRSCFYMNSLSNKQFSWIISIFEYVMQAWTAQPIKYRPWASYDADYSWETRFDIGWREFQRRKGISTPQTNSQPLYQIINLYMRR